MLGLSALSVIVAAMMALNVPMPGDIVMALTMIAIIGALLNAVQTTMYALAAHVYPVEIRGTGVGTAVAVGPHRQRARGVRRRLRAEDVRRARLLLELGDHDGARARVTGGGAPTYREERCRAGARDALTGRPIRMPNAKCKCKNEEHRGKSQRQGLLHLCILHFALLALICAASSASGADQSRRRLGRALSGGLPGPRARP